MSNLSIIISVLSKDNSWDELLNELLKFQGDFEILIIGPDFENKTSGNSKVRYIYSNHGRAKQYNIGARVAQKANLWFLHDDLRLSIRPLKKIEDKLRERPEAIYFFDLNFLSDGPRLMFLNTIGVYWRSHFLKLPLGDQGLFMAKQTFFSLGLFNEKAAYGEDQLLIWKARQRNIPILPASAELFTSARTYKNFGWLTTTFRHVLLTYKLALSEWVKYFESRNKKKRDTAIAIFVKTPGLSIVKSRLAADLGKELAEDFFRLSIKATESAVIEAVKRSEGKIEAFYAVAEKDGLHNPLWNSFKTIYQGSGELGERIASVYAKLQKTHKRVFLIGADMPQINYKTLLKAQYQLILRSDYVLGKTHDGGVYLFGGRKIIERDIWNSIRYSSGSTSSELIAQLGEKHCKYLEENFDIDYVEDLEELSRYSIDDLLPEQIEVIDWAKKYSSKQE